MLKLNSKQTENPRFTLAAFSHCLLGCSLLALGSQAFASSEPRSDTTDSAFAWGMWEYNIAPAAGGLHNLNASPLNPRSAKVTLRTNSNAALAPGGTAEFSPNIRPGVPAAPAAPAPAAAPAPPPPAAPAPPPPAQAVPVTPQGAPNIGVASGTPGGTSTSGTGGLNFNF